MTWFKVDDQFHSHPKVTATTLAARGLWVTAGSWSSAHLTDGVVPDHVLALLGGTPELAAELVAAGLWTRTRGAHRFHDWKAYQPSSKEVANLRAQRAEAGRKGGLARKNRRSKREANASGVASGVLEPPTRPDPPPSQREGGSGAALRADARGAPAPPPEPDTHPPHSNGRPARAAPPPDNTALRQQLAAAAAKRHQRDRARADPLAELRAATPTTPATDQETTDA